MRLLISLGVLLLLGGCSGDEMAAEQQNNPYITDYQNIYRNYGKLPNDTIEAQLQRYLSRFKYAGHAKLMLGKIYYDKRDFPKALNIYNEAYQDDTLNTDAAICLGIMYRINANYDSAKYYLNKGIKKDTYGNARFNLAYISLLTNDTAAAYTSIKHTAAKMPRSANYAKWSWLAYQLKSDSLGNQFLAKAALRDSSLIKEIMNPTSDIDDLSIKYHLL